MNNVVLIGRLTKDPELRFTPSTGTAVGTFTIAVDRDFKKEGQPTADFLNVVVWSKQAENCANYLIKGQLVGVRGRIQTRNYEDKQGQRRYITEIVAKEVKFLGKPIGNNAATENNKPYDEDIVPIDDGDIPF